MVLAAVATAAVLSGLSVVRAFSTAPSPSSDFGALWRAGKWALGSHGDSLYPMSSFGTAGQDSAEPFLGYLNPPHASAVFAPFGSLQFDAATNLFLGVNLVCLVVLVVATVRWLRSRAWPRREILLSVLLVLACPALAATLVNGTISLWLVLVMGALIRMDHPGDHYGTGVLAAVLTIKPQYAVLPVLFLLGQRHWRAVASMVGSTAALVLASLPVTGVSPWLAYGPFLSRYAGFADLWGSLDSTFWIPVQMPNLRGLLLRVFGLDAVTTVNVVTAIALGGATLVVVVLGNRVRVGSNLAGWSAVMCLGVLTGQHTNAADALVLVVAVLALAAVPGVRRGHVLGALALLGASLAFGNPAGVVPAVPWSAVFVVVLSAATLALLAPVGRWSRAVSDDTRS